MHLHIKGRPLWFLWATIVPETCNIGKFQDILSYRCRSKQIFGIAKDFCPNFPKLARKVVVRLLPKNLLPQRLLRPFFGATSKKDLHLFFCKYWVPFFEVKQRWAPFLPRFSGILPRYCGILPGFSGILPKFSGILPGFSTNQNFGGELAPPEPPPPTALYCLESFSLFNGFKFFIEQMTRKWDSVIADLPTFMQKPPVLLFLTDGHWEVTQLLHHDSKTRTVYYISNELHPGMRHVYATRIGSRKRSCLTCELIQTDVSNQRCAYYAAQFGGSSEWFLLRCLGLSCFCD